MIPPITDSQLDIHSDIAAERLGLEPRPAGRLEGILANPLYLGVIGVALVMFGFALLVAAYVAGDYEVGFGRMPSGGAPYALTVLAFVFVVGGGIYVLLASAAWYSRNVKVAEDEFKSEPRDYDYRGVGGGTHYHEVIKVRCRYCGTLNEPTAEKCIACGGNP